jgi:hypothetical protein
MASERITRIRRLDDIKGIRQGSPVIVNYSKYTPNAQFHNAQGIFLQRKKDCLGTSFVVVEEDDHMYKYSGKDTLVRASVGFFSIIGAPSFREYCKKCFGGVN